METTNATLGGTLSNADINDLPLNGRNYQSLMGLRPGVMLQPGGSPWTQSTNNIRPDETVWMVDGVINANVFDSRPIAGASSPFTDGATILPIDAIQEFNIEENPKAEYGWRPGAMVNVGIRSGTNNLHGSAYAFGRDGSWDARNVFNPAPNPVLPAASWSSSAARWAGRSRKTNFSSSPAMRACVPSSATPSAPPFPKRLRARPDPKHSMVDAIVALQTASVPVSPLSLTLLGCPAGQLTLASTCTGGVIQKAPANTTSLCQYCPQH